MREIDIESVGGAANDRAGFFRVLTTATVTTPIPSGSAELALNLSEASARNLHLAVGRILANLDKARGIT